MGKGGRCLGLTTLPFLCAGSQRPGAHRVCLGITLPISGDRGPHVGQPCLKAVSLQCLKTVLIVRDARCVCIFIRNRFSTSHMPSTD